MSKKRKQQVNTSPVLQILKPKTKGQHTLCKTLEDDSKRVILVSGPAGTGKTSIASFYALKGLVDGVYQKVFITRPAVEACGENFGFLKGGLDSKIYPYLIPIYDEFEKHLPAFVIGKLKQERKIEIAPLAFMRGRNLETCFVILDEAQNATLEQFKMAITRLHDDSKIVICGDFDQSDRKGAKDFQELCMRLSDLDFVSHVALTKDDIVRSKFISQILERLNENA